MDELNLPIDVMLKIVPILFILVVACWGHYLTRSEKPQKPQNEGVKCLGEDLPTEEDKRQKPAYLERYGAVIQIQHWN